MGKPTFWICQNKGAVQVRGNCKADQCLSFCYTNSTIPATYIQSFKLLVFFCDSTDRSVSDLAGNPNCWSRSHAMAHIKVNKME